MTEEEMREAMIKALGGEGLEDDGDDEDGPVEPATEAEIEGILSKIKDMQLAEKGGKKGKKKK